MPAAITTARLGRSLGTPISVALAILGGTIVMYTYLLWTYGFNWILAVNYSAEAISWGIIVWYHYLPCPPSGDFRPG